MLLLTLLLLALCASLMLALCRKSLRTAADARDAQRALGQRWAALSCSYTLLPQCEAVLAGGRSGGTEGFSRRRLSLGRQSVELVFADEQAKTSVSELLARRGPEDARIALRELATGSPLVTGIRLRPTRVLSADDGELPTADSTASTTRRAIEDGTSSAVSVGGFGQVFDRPAPTDLLGLESSLGKPPAQTLTCWGDGRLNWKRASEAALRLRLCPPLDFNHVARLLALRAAKDAKTTAATADPAPSLSAALDQCALTTVQRRVAEAALCDESLCHSLWVILRPTEEQGPLAAPDGPSATSAAAAGWLRTRFYFYALDESAGKVRVSAFEW